MEGPVVFIVTPPARVITLRGMTAAIEEPVQHVVRVRPSGAVKALCDLSLAPGVIQRVPPLVGEVRSPPRYCRRCIEVAGRRDWLRAPPPAWR